MAVRKFAPKPTAEDLRIKDRVMRAKQHRSPVDRTSRYHEQLCELAREVGADAADVIDNWSERSAVREYCGAASRDEAEFLAMDDVRQFYRRSA